MSVQDARKESSPMKAHLGRMLNAMTWADAQSFGAIRDHLGTQAEALQLFGHVLAAEEAWLARLESRPQRCPVWPTLSVAECETLAAENTRGYQQYCSKLTDSELESPVRYKNTKGDEYVNSVLDILTHVVIHGAYHRGQIARIIGRAGGQSPNTDFIAYIRSVEHASA
jgi:uncharacterized damage-inducible protein DinB